MATKRQWGIQVRDKDWIREPLNGRPAVGLGGEMLLLFDTEEEAIEESKELNKKWEEKNKNPMDIRYKVKEYKR
tara:strand:- start:655 stop:876 length:222 start_codon:yes stop_codon:yes gene_type:complete